MTKYPPVGSVVFMQPFQFWETSNNISETTQESCCYHKPQTVVIEDLSTSSNCNNLDCPWRSCPYCNLV